MKNKPQYVVIHKDHPKSVNRYFGPFVSESIAVDFMHDLPPPQNGGQVTYKRMSPYSFAERKLAAHVILAGREFANPFDR